MINCFRPLLLFTAASAIFLSAFSQPTVEFDKNFKSFAGFNNTVQAIEATPDGGYICGGYFTTYNWNPAVGLLKFNADNEVDSTFHQGLSVAHFEYITDIAPSIDGGYFIVGSFTKYDDVFTSGIIKINADGTLDGSFNSGAAGFDSLSYPIPYKVEQLPDGNILVGGSFIKYNGLFVQRLIRLLPSGAIDNTFYFPILATSVNDFEALPDGDIIVGGKFAHTYSGITKYNIEKLNSDGSIDSIFHVAGTGTNFTTFYQVYAVEPTVDGKILIGGYFTSVNGFGARELARLNLDGSIDTTFVTSIFSGSIRDLVVKDENIFYVGADINLTGVDAEFLALNSDGSPNLTFPYYSSNSAILDIEFDYTGKILLGGSFGEFGNRVEHDFIRLNEDGTIDETNNGKCGASLVVFDGAVIDDGSLIIGGSFKIYDKYQANSLAKLHADGTFDTSFEIGTGFNDEVLFVRELADGKLLIAGDFTSYNGVTKNHLLRLHPDGTLDPLFSVGPGPLTYSSSTLKDIELLPEGKIIVSGNFSTFAAVTKVNMVKLFSNGTPDLSFTAPSISSIYKTQLQPDGKIIVVGGFTTVGGLSKKGVCRLNTNGSIDMTYNSGTGGTTIYDCALLPDGKVIIVGTFTLYDGVAVNKVARLLNNGSIDTSFHIGSGASSTVNCVRLLPDGKILLTGSFDTFNGIPVNKMVVLNSDGSVFVPFVEDFGTGFTDNIDAVTIDNNGDILVLDGLKFQNYNYDRICRLNYTSCTDTYDTIYAEIYEGDVYSLPDEILVSEAGTYTSTIGAGFYCDSIITTVLSVVPPPCLTPGSIEVSNITSSSARITWTAAAGASQYNLWYRPAGVATWTKKNVTTTNRKLTGLTPSTTYEYKIRTKCGLTYSPFSSISTFATLPLKDGEIDQSMEITIYPNPGHSLFTIETSGITTFGNLFVLDITGKCIYQNEIEGAASIIIDLSNYPPGLYVVKYISTNYSCSTNLIKL